MGKNEVKKRKDELDDKNNVIVNRMMIMFVLATAVIVALLLLDKQPARVVSGFRTNVIPYIQIASAVLLIGAIVFKVIRYNKKVFDGNKVLSSSTLLTLSIIFFSLSALYKFLGNSKTVIAVIGVLVVAFVWYFFQKDYFYYTIYTIISVLLLFGIRNGPSPTLIRNIIYFASYVLVVLIPVVLLIMLMTARKNKGVFKVGGKRYLIMKPSYLYFPFFVGIAVTLIGAILGFILSSLVIYVIIALFAAYLIFGIVYTVKMM